jgi:hypothetical protein
MYLNYKPKHVVVYSKSDYLYDIFDKVLLSLGKVFTGDNFDYRTLLKFSKKIQQVRNLYPNNTIYIDSGGYSIIVGDIPQYTIPKLIELYNYFLENYNEYFDRIFSLDIPLSLKLNINYYDKLYELNYQSQSKTVDVIKKEKDNVRNKLYFVWQFKTKNLFKIWKDIFNELKLYKHYKFYSVGGLVGLKNFANIKFSGYIVPVLYAVFLYKEHYPKTFFKKHKVIPYHILGQYASVDQLTILVLEEFIRRKYDINLDITYDSAAIHSEFINLKDKDLYFYNFDGTKVLTINELNEILDDNIHFHITNNKDVFYEVANNIKNNQRMQDIDAARFIYGLHIVSREFEFSKYKNKLTDILLEPDKNIKHKLNTLQTYLHKLRSKSLILSNILTDNFINSFLNNMKALLHFSSKYDIDTKDNMMNKWIEVIGLDEFIH